MGSLRPSRKRTVPPVEEADQVANNCADVNNDLEQKFSEEQSPAAAQSTPTPPQRDAWTARGKLLLNFHDAISRAINSPEMKQKCAQVASYMSASEEEESINTDYDAEATLIVKNKYKRDAIVREKALSVGICTLAALRLVPIARTAVTRRMSSAAQYKFESTSSKLMNQKTQQNAAHEPARLSPLRKFLRLMLDVTISSATTVLSGTFLFTPRPSAYIEDMSKLPLVEGKSVYAEVVCPPLLTEYKRTMEQYGGRWPVMTRGRSSTANSSLTQEDVSLNVIRKFAENCTKRSKYERAVLEEQQAFCEEEKNKLGTVSIPRAVPDDVRVNIDEEVFFLIDDDVTKESKAY